MAKRQIVKIDQEKCDGCGMCVPSCAEGAIVIVDGKAQLLADKFCDGLGACLGECPKGALTIEERDTEEFVGPAPGAPGEHGHQEAAKPQATPAQEAFVCPGSAMRQFTPAAAPQGGASALGHWPVKLRLVSPKALTGILKENDVKGVTIVNMEVPCCNGLIEAVRRALEAAGQSLPVSICTLGAQGQVVQQAKIKAA
jgi:Pyruvate/2-oxoacid:ferredoxin oxidoreductase delta subunit